MSYVFNDTTYVNHGLIQECEDITGLGAGAISGNTAKMKTFARRLSLAKDRFFVIAFKNDALWSLDDRRYADSDQNLPIGMSNLVSGTGDYLLDDELLVGSQFFVKDPSDNYVELLPQDDRTLPSAYLSRESGTPTKYELVGNSIILDKIPNYTPTLDGDGKNYGLKVVFKRAGVPFGSGDGAVPIGIPSVFFEYLANYASYPYLIEKGLKHAPLVKQVIMEDENIHIPAFISNRAKPKRSGLRVSNLWSDSAR